jgi:hypothetical protein
MAYVQQVMVRSPADDRRCLITSPDGKEIEVPRELFAILSDFMVTRKDAGSMVVQFRNGGVAGLETLIKKKYK